MEQVKRRNLSQGFFERGLVALAVELFRRRIEPDPHAQLCFTHPAYKIPHGQEPAHRHR